MRSRASVPPLTSHRYADTVIMERRCLQRPGSCSSSPPSAAARLEWRDAVGGVLRDENENRKENLLLRGLVLPCSGGDCVVLRRDFSHALCGLELVARVYPAESPFAGKLLGSLATLRRVF